MTHGGHHGGHHGGGHHGGHHGGHFAPTHGGHLAGHHGGGYMGPSSGGSQMAIGCCAVICCIAVGMVLLIPGVILTTIFQPASSTAGIILLSLGVAGIVLGIIAAIVMVVSRRHSQSNLQPRDQPTAIITGYAPPPAEMSTSLTQPTTQYNQSYYPDSSMAPPPAFNPNMGPPPAFNPNMGPPPAFNPNVAPPPAYNAPYPPASVPYQSDNSFGAAPPPSYGAVHDEKTPIN